MQNEKTNPMRHLDKLKIPYEPIHTEGEFVSGLDVAMANGQDPSRVFKSLMTMGKEKCYYCFMVPVTGELDLKKAAASVGEKSVTMLKSDQLLPLMGYVHGGCSPIGLKKPFPVTIDETAQLFDRVYVSGGRKGFQIGLSPTDLKEYCNAKFCDILA